MVKSWSPFEDIESQFPIKGKNIELSIAEVGALYSIQATAEVIVEELGMPTDLGVGGTTSQDEKRLICLGPDKWLLIAKNPIPEPGYILVDVTQTHCWLDLDGTGAMAILNNLTPFDFNRLHVGSVAATEILGLAVIIERLTEAKFLIGTATTNGPFLSTSLIDAIALAEI